jgi:hypothetical protein
VHLSDCAHIGQPGEGNMIHQLRSYGAAGSRRSPLASNPPRLAR